MDSGLGMESNRGSPPQRQEDSGCGSMGGSESSTSCNSQTEEHPLLDGRTDSLKARTREDSGAGLGCQLDCSANPYGPESDGGGNYRSQSKEGFKPTLTDSLLTDVVTGYRAGHHPCVCEGAGQCTWCHKRDHYGPEEIRPYTAASIESGPVGSKDNFSYSYRGEHRFPVYSREGHVQMETEWTDDSKTSPPMSFTQLSEDFPLLTALSSLPLVEGGQDFSSVSLSLCDVELQDDWCASECDKAISTTFLKNTLTLLTHHTHSEAWNHSNIQRFGEEMFHFWSTSNRRGCRWRKLRFNSCDKHTQLQAESS